MKRLILAAMVCVSVPAGGAAAQEPPVSDAAAGMQDVQSRLEAALDAMTKTNDEDFYTAASLVIEATHDEGALPRLMAAEAEKGSAAAQYWLARYLLPTAARDASAAPRAARLLEQASDRKYVPAMVEYSRLLGAGLGCDADRKRAIEVLMDACKQGGRRARAVYLAFSGRVDEGRYDAPEMASELKKGNFYLEELIAMRQTDAAEAERWLRSADSHGSAFAPFALSQMGLPGVTDKEGLELLRRAAERHSAEAMGTLGLALLREDLLKAADGERLMGADVDEGVRLLLIAASLGDTLAGSSLAALSAWGDVEIKGMTPERICELFRRAYLCGDEASAPGLGYCMVTGRGCSQDAEGGMALLEEGRKNGSALWVNQALASLYFNGDGVKADMRKAIDALGEDAAAGSEHAYAIMAALTALGNADAEPDARAARFYLQMAKESGDLQAQSVYDAILSVGGWRYMPGLFAE